MKNFQELSRDYPKEVPLVRELLRTVAKIQAEQERLTCQVDALIRYHESCASAERILEADLDKCPKL